jgi:hypothetical protein
LLYELTDEKSTIIQQNITEMNSTDFLSAFYATCFFWRNRLAFQACLLTALLLMLPAGRGEAGPTQEPYSTGDELMEAGVARVDITPEGPIRLAGYGGRQGESEGVIQQLEAKALAFGSDEQGPSILITVDLIGIPGHITTRLAESLQREAGLDPARLTIAASHTHTGPEIGNLLNHFGEPLPPEQLGNIDRYLEQLSVKLEQVALAALENRTPARVAWGQGEVGFAMNRRELEDGRWVGFGVVPEGPVDHALPLLRVTDPDGNLKALLVNYACHGTTLGPDVNEIHGDWMGEAQRIIEQRHPEAVAMVAIGAGADANPELRLEMQHTTRHGKEIADEVDRLLNTSLKPLTVPPAGRSVRIDLPYADVPGIDELVQQAGEGRAKGYYAHLALDRMARGESMPTNLSYPVQAWTFGDELAMVFLAGEVVVDYALRLKEELGDDLWVTAYANDVPSYIASRRVIREGGYEVESSMYSYDRPSPFAEEVEDLIVETVHNLLSEPAGEAGTLLSKPETVRTGTDGILHLRAEQGRPIGPEIEYMPEWRAFGWFTAEDRVEWEVEVDRTGEYEVFLEWSVSDEEAGKPYVFTAGDKQLTGTVGRTGSWEIFHRKKIGTVRLQEGTHTMIFRPDSHFDEGALLDLRMLQLIPMK